MAVKAKAEITLAAITDIQSLTRYYLVQSSTSSVPAKPTTFTPPSGWTTTEPAYDSTGTYSLYITDRTVFSDGTFAYSDVSLSSSYEAAKEAYNTATAAKGIAERATHSLNLIPYGSRSFDDEDYWINGFVGGGEVGAQGVIWNTEQLADGWIRVNIDATEYTGTAKYVSDNVKVRKSPSIKPNTEYTFLYEIRNNNSVLAETSGNNSTFYIQEATGNQFWGNATAEVLEGTGASGSFVLRTMAPEPNVTYRKRFTKMSDAGTHAGNNPAGLFQMQYRCGNADYLDFELRISVYEGRYLGDYMPYVISDTTDIEADISAANALAQSAKDTADGKITTFYAASDDIPTATTVGDLWIKTDDGNSLWRWNGTSWVSVDNADIQSALTAAGTAQATADSKIITFAQSSQPTATDVGDIWIDTDNNNKLYRWDGSAWVDVHDPQIAEANEKIDNLEVGGRNLMLNTLHPGAAAAARPRIKGMTTNPSGRGACTAAEHGMRWTLTSVNWPYIGWGASSYAATPSLQGLEPGVTYTFSADLSWKVLSSDTGKADDTTYYMSSNLNSSAAESGAFEQHDRNPQFPITQADKGTEMSGRLVHTFTVPEDAKRAHFFIQINGGAANNHYAIGDYIEARNIKLEKGNKATDWTPAPEDLDEAVTAAQETANGKNTVYYQAEAPSGGTYKTNDIWFDTDNGNKMYMWNGSAWTPEEFGNAAISDLSITNAKIANGTIESAKISNLDAGKITSGTMSAARIKGDELKLGGDNNADGVMKVYNADGDLVGSFTKEGLEVIAGTIAGWTINPGELYTEWDQSTSHYKVRLSSGLTFEHTILDEGFEQYLEQIQYHTQNQVFLHRDRDGFQTAGFISGIGGTAPGSSVDGGISISPNLLVGGGDGAIYADQLRISTIVNGSYIRQPQLILSGKTSISGGTSQKRATICSIPTEYQSGWLIVPFVTRTYGNSGVAPADNGDFYYAYYNSADHEVCIKLANLLPSGVAFTFDYLIYAVPES